MNQKPFPIGTVLDLYGHVSLLQGFSTFHDFPMLELATITGTAIANRALARNAP